MSNAHPMYVCDLCGYARYHSLSYCPKCPGRLTKKDIPHPPDRASGSCFKTAKEQTEWLKEQGLDWSWEECAISPCTILANRLAELVELESFCSRMTMRGSDGKLTPDGSKWRERTKIIREAIKRLTFVIAKVDIPKTIMDESWAILEPFYELQKEKKQKLAATPEEKQL